MSEKKYYCYCSSNCRYETMTKEQILAAIAQATGVQDVDPDAGFISKVRETNGGQYVSFWVGTQAEYNKIAEKATNCLYIITDDNTKTDFERMAATMLANCEAAGKAATEAKSIANQALSLAGATRVLNREYEDTSAPRFVEFPKDDYALFYIVEVINPNNMQGGFYERHTVTLDAYQLSARKAYCVGGRADVLVYGYESEGNIAIEMQNISGTDYRITRCISYCRTKDEPSPLSVLRVLNMAEKEVGYLEKASNAQLDDKTANAGSNNYTKYARDLDAISGFYNTPKNGAAWCAVFTDWCFVQAYGVDNAKNLTRHSIYGAGVNYAANGYRNNGQFYTSDPKVGDEIFFGDVATDYYEHTGIVYKVDSTYVYTIEGNTNNAVVKKQYSLTDSTIIGYGRPNYEER